MSSQQFTNFALKALQQSNYVALSTLRKYLNYPDDPSVIREALTFRHQHEDLQILCLVTFEHNNIVYTRYNVDSFAQQLVMTRKSEGKSIQDIFVEFLCLFRPSYFHFNNIVQIMIDSTKKMYTDALEHQIQRKLTLISPNAIMKNGKKYSETNSVPIKFGLSQTSSKDSIASIENPKKAPLQKTKTQANQLPRMKETKPQTKQEEPIRKPVLKKANLPVKKLQIQSDSEDIYEPEKFMETIGNKPISRGEPMQIQQQENYKQNNLSTAQKVQKQQIEEKMEIMNKKDNSPGSNTNVDEEDSVNMDEMMEMMNKEATKKNDKGSIGGKSLPGVKQTKLEFGKSEAAKSVATKQPNLFNWMGKK